MDKVRTEVGSETGRRFDWYVCTGSVDKSVVEMAVEDLVFFSTIDKSVNL